MKKKITEIKNRFNIDFFEFCFLVEACIPQCPIARAMFWDDVINKHYHVLTQNERNRLFEWINRDHRMQDSLENGNEDCQLFNARFDPNNQYNVITTYRDGVSSSHECFKWQDRYHISKNQSICDEFINEVSKIEIHTDL